MCSVHDLKSDIIVPDRNPAVKKRWFNHEKELTNKGNDIIKPRLPHSSCSVQVSLLQLQQRVLH